MYYPTLVLVFINFRPFPGTHVHIAVRKATTPEPPKPCVRTEAIKQRFRKTLSKKESLRKQKFMVLMRTGK